MPKYNLLIAEAARFDIVEAFEWYDEIDSKLGQSLTAHIEAALETIQGNPNLFQKRYKRIRIHFIKRFPYPLFRGRHNDKGYRLFPYE